MISLAASQSMPETLHIETINELIRVLRGQRVMLDSDLAWYYGVETKVLNQAVRRNKHRFPKDFAFHPKREELMTLRSQIVTSNIGRGGRRYTPWVFTEHGAVMLASLLNSSIAITASVEIVRAFVKMRNDASPSVGDLMAKLLEIDGRLGAHDKDLNMLITTVRKMLAFPRPFPDKEPEMGFHVREEAGESAPALPKKPRKKVTYR
ncbi:MAG: ORF6N domain-containing protein [Chthoniobacteraceae bacterium]